MLYKRIQYFLEAANCLNFSTAAKRLYMTQQAMTWHISSLEKELGVKLFERTTRSVKLTGAGSYLRDQFSRINYELTYAIQKAQEMNSLKTDSLNVGIYESFSRSSIILPLTTLLWSRSQKVTFQVRLMGLTELQNSLFDRKLDICITTSYNWNSLSAASVRVLDTLPFKLILSKRHPLADQPFDLENFRTETLLTTESPLFTQGNSFSGRLPSWRHKIPCKGALYLQDMETLMLYLEAGKGFALLTGNLSGLNSGSFLIYDLPFEEANADMICVYRESDSTDNLLCGVCKDIAKNYDKKNHRFYELG